jgi:hypothetical protein
MTKRIWKYELKNTDLQKVHIPKGGEILTVQTLNDKPCLWVLVDTSQPQPLEERMFEIFGTGDLIQYDMGTDRKYIGTYQLYGGDLVFHLFEYIGV